MSGGTIWGIRRSLRHRNKFQITVTPDGVLRQGDWLESAFLRREKIIGFSEPKKDAGLVLLSSARPPLTIPPDLEGFSECQAELIAMGIPRIVLSKKEKMAPFALMAICFVGLFLVFSGNAWQGGIGLALVFAGIFWRDYKRIFGARLSVQTFLWPIVIVVFWLAHNIWHVREMTFSLLFAVALVLAPSMVLWKRKKGAFGQGRSTR